MTGIIKFIYLLKLIEKKIKIEWDKLIKRNFYIYIKSIFK